MVLPSILVPLSSTPPQPPTWMFVNIPNRSSSCGRLSRQRWVSWPAVPLQPVVLPQPVVLLDEKASKPDGLMLPPRKRKLRAMWLHAVVLRTWGGCLLVAVAVLWPGARVAWGFVFLGLSFFSGRRPNDGSPSASNRGRHVPAPRREGRRVKSKGHRPQNRYFQVYPIL